MTWGSSVVSAGTRVSTWTAGVLAAVALASTVAAQQPAQPQPSLFAGGAQSIAESYQDWQMMCGQAQGAKQCAVVQQLSDSKTGQRILSVEMRPQGDKTEGVLLMPFGLALEKGVSIRVGEADVASALPYKTCLLPAGCLVTFSFDAKTVAALRKASTLTVNAAGEADKAVPFSISLNGFGAAYDRAIALAK
jgi:invasion protein IalB